MKYVELKNNLGMKVTLSSVGAGIYDIEVPDKNGKIESVTLTADKEWYPKAIGFYGKICGRTAGRISNKAFIIDGEKFDLEAGSGNKHCLHGGVETFAYKEFLYSTFEDSNFVEAIFSYKSPDLEGGYPGELTLVVTYKLMKNANILEMKFKYFTTRKTVCNLTNHIYFNLSGNCKRKVLDEELYINATKVGLVDGDGLAYDLVDIPSYLDFNTPKLIGIDVECNELKSRFGYDNPYVLGDDELKASLYDKESGRLLNMYSTNDTLVIYTDNFPEDIIISNGKKQEMYDSIALEFQHFPNSINSGFIDEKKDIILPKNTYEEVTIFEFLNK